MAAKLRWREQWFPEGGQNGKLFYREQWADAHDIVQFSAFTPVGHVTITPTGFVIVGVHALGDVELDAVGHLQGNTPLTIQQEDVLAIDPPSFDFGGHAAVTGNFDFEEPFFIDPPLEVISVGHATLAATDLISKFPISRSFSGFAPKGHLGFQTVTLQYPAASVKQLFSVTLGTRGHVGFVGEPVARTDRILVTQPIAARGHFGFLVDLIVESPGPNVIELGDVTLNVIGGPNLIGDPAWTDQPPTEIGDATMDMGGRMTIGSFLFAGGACTIGVGALSVTGHLGARRIAISLPGADVIESEIVATYEGLDMQGFDAELEGEDLELE